MSEIDLHLERRHIATVLHDVIEIRLTASANQVNCLDLRFDRADELLAARDRLVASVKLVADLPDVC